MDSEFLMLLFYRLVKVIEGEIGTIILAWLFGALFLTFMYCFKRSKDSSIPFVKFPMLCIEEVDKDKYLLDLPDLALDSILTKLSPANLSRMSRVCTSLRGMCTSDRSFSSLNGARVNHMWYFKTSNLYNL